MKTVGIVQLTQAKAPINQLVTKFGGQPVWLEAPKWPLNKNTQEPLAFIGQIVLEKKIYGTTPAKVAYLFINPEDFADSALPEDGENAVILQPGNNAFYDCIDASTGPALQHSSNTTFDTDGLCEFEVTLEYREEVPVDELKYKRIMLDMENQPSSFIQEEEVLAVLGGTPAWMQADDSLFDNARLIIQMEEDMPFQVDFGMGDLYAFMNEAGTEAKCLWQT